VAKEQREEPEFNGRGAKFLEDDYGASTGEYALLVVLIAAVIVGAVTLLGGNLKATFDYVSTIVLKL
jgi:pilus assembly protein Flp/PilA